MIVRKKYFIIMLLAAAMAVFTASCGKTEKDPVKGGNTTDEDRSWNKKSERYGVFLGINRDETAKLRDYDIVVIEPAEFTKTDVDKLHKEGKTVYAYLNIGAVENYRPYYSKFQKITLGVYDDWPDERWIDVSKKEWQQFLIEELGKKYVDMSFDGFFLDNADVYYHYHQNKIYRGLKTVLKGLRPYGKTLLINGGDSFVSKMIKEKHPEKFFDGVNQETVFTSIDFDKGTFGKQKKSETLYFDEYLSKVKKAGLSVYLLEYGAAPSLAKTINRYCRKNGFRWYNAKDLALR